MKLMLCFSLLYVALSTLVPAVAFADDTDDALAARPRGHIESRVEKKRDAALVEETEPFTFDLSYAQSADAWSVVHDVRSAEGNLSAINDVLSHEYGSPQEAFSDVTASYRVRLGDGPRDHVYFGSSAEALGYGLVQNPVVPELHLTAAAVGLFGGGYAFDTTQGGPHLRIGGVGGFGRERRVDATSTDLIESIPLRSGALSIYGFDFDVTQSFALEHEVSMNLMGSVKETLFNSTTPPEASSAIDDQKPSMLTHRWKALGELAHGLSLVPFDRATLAVQGVAGPQPIPADLLPRIWDYAHSLYPTPELGALFGGGLSLTGSFSRSTLLTTHAGYYGGYVGGDLSVKLGAVQVAAATYGLEDSPAYHVLGERIWQASLSFLL